ncbi:E3 ubiquitin-protein ligase RNF8 isoform X3 [Engystomops pustulosus]|uniref:E3 ubiquitin-protein ligase RNF8 isoform X3 n=1 Tax=Engystomops pustulosus TaxID=76066 RepID=UPI003AFAACD6
MAEPGEGRSDHSGGGGGMCWCLRRLGGSRDVLLLPEGEEVTLGRGVDVTYQLQSPLCPLMVSRVHCILRQDAQRRWTITDNRSLNGVFVNKEKLEPGRAYVLAGGSRVQVGVMLPNAEGSELEYEFVQEDLEQIRPLLIPPQSGKRKSSRSKRKMNCEDPQASGTEAPSSSSKAKIQRVSRESKDAARSQKPEVVERPVTVQEVVERPVTVQEVVERPVTVQEVVERPEVVQELVERPVALEEVVELDGSLDAELMSTQTPSSFHLTKMRQSIVELRNLNTQVQEKLKNPRQGGPAGSEQLQDLQKELSTRHQEHLQQVDQLKKVLQEKQGSADSAEERLKEQLAQALHEHSLLMEDLNRSHRDFEQIIQEKNKELQETKEEKEKVKAQKEEVLNHMSDVLDNELQCVICSEHFIEAVTLNCAHSFCSFCIQSWRKRKEECPMCRQAITTQTRSLVLDNCIDRMVTKLSPEMRDRRLALILHRKDLVAEVTPIVIPSDSDDGLSDIFLRSSSSEDMEDFLSGHLEEEDDEGDGEDDEDAEGDEGSVFSDDASDYDFHPFDF